MERALESPLDCKETKPVNLKKKKKKKKERNQSGIFIESTYALAEAPISWPPDVKKRLIGKDPDAGKV